MKNQYAVFVGADEFRTENYFDVDSTDGVDVYDPGGKYIGAITGLTIPDIDNEAECEMYAEEVTYWLNENYF